MVNLKKLLREVDKRKTEKDKPDKIYYTNGQYTQWDKPYFIFPATRKEQYATGKNYSCRYCKAMLLNINGLEIFRVNNTNLVMQGMLAKKIEHKTCYCSIY